jgi:hypothetical protein
MAGKKRRQKEEKSVVSAGEAAAPQAATAEPKKDTPGHAGGGNRFRRGLWIGGSLTIGVLLGIGLLLWLIAFVYIRGGFLGEAVARDLRQNMAAPVEIGSLNTIGMQGMRITDVVVGAQGATSVRERGATPALVLPEINIAWQPTAILLDKRIAALSLENPEVRLALREDGSWNFQPRPSKEKSPYRLEGLRVSEGSFSFSVPAGGSLALQNINAFMSAPLPDGCAPFSLAARWPSGGVLELRGETSGPNAAAGRLRLDSDLNADFGSLWPATLRPAGKITGTLSFRYAANADDERQLDCTGSLRLRDARLPLSSERSLRFSNVGFAFSADAVMRRTDRTTEIIFSRTNADLEPYFHLGLGKSRVAMRNGETTVDLQDADFLFNPSAVADALTSAPPRALTPNVPMGFRHVSCSLTGPPWRPTLRSLEAFLGHEGEAARITLREAEDASEDDPLLPPIMHALRNVSIESVDADLARLLTLFLSTVKERSAAAPDSEFPTLRGKIAGRNLKIKLSPPSPPSRAAVSLIPVAHRLVLSDLSFSDLVLPPPTAGRFLPSPDEPRRFQGTIGLSAGFSAAGSLLNAAAEIAFIGSGTTPLRGRFLVHFEAPKEGGVPTPAEVFIRELVVPGKELAAWMALPAPQFAFDGALVFTDCKVDLRTPAASGTTQFKDFSAIAAGFGVAAVKGALHWQVAQKSFQAQLRLDSWRRTTPLAVSPPLPAVEAEGRWRVADETRAADLDLRLNWTASAPVFPTAAPTEAPRSLALNLRLESPLAAGLYGAQGSVTCSFIPGLEHGATCELAWNPRTGWYGPLTLKTARLSAAILPQLARRFGAVLPEETQTTGELRDVEWTMQKFLLNFSGGTKNAVAAAGRALQLLSRPETALSWRFAATVADGGLRFSPQAPALEKLNGQLRLNVDAMPDVAAGSASVWSTALSIVPEDFSLTCGDWTLASAKTNNDAGAVPEFFARTQILSTAHAWEFRWDRLTLFLPDVLRCEGKGYGTFPVAKSLAVMSGRAAAEPFGEMTTTFSTPDLGVLPTVFRFAGAPENAVRRVNVAGPAQTDLRIAWGSSFPTDAPATEPAPDKSLPYACLGAVKLNGVSLHLPSEPPLTISGLTGALPLAMCRGPWPLLWPKETRETLRCAALALGPLRAENAVWEWRAIPDGLTLRNEPVFGFFGGTLRLRMLALRDLFTASPEAAFHLTLEALNLDVLNKEQAWGLRGLEDAFLAGDWRNCRAYRDADGVWAADLDGEATAELFGGRFALDKLRVRQASSVSPLWAARLRLQGADAAAFCRANPTAGLLSARLDVVLDELRTTSLKPADFRSFKLHCASVASPSVPEFFDGRFALWAARTTALNYARAAGISEEWLRDRRFGLEKMDFSVALAEGDLMLKPEADDGDRRPLFLKSRGEFTLHLGDGKEIAMSWREALRLLRAAFPASAFAPTTNK